MSYRDPNEADDAQSRIDRIRGGGSSQPAQPELPPYEEAAPRSASRAGRAAPSGSKASAGRASGAAPSRGSQAILFIAAVVIVGIVIVGALILFSGALGGGGGGLSLFATQTPTPTATFTPSPTSTETPTPTATATPTAPRLTLPPLTCIFQSGVGCRDYCSNAANTNECNAARSFIENQGASFDSWLTCLAPGAGPNVGNPQDCLVAAWYARNVPAVAPTVPAATATP